MLFSNGSYLADKDMWNWCKAPENVVEFNVALFSTLLAAACMELVLCLIQMVNGLFGCICGTCSGNKVRPEQSINFYDAPDYTMFASALLQLTYIAHLSA